LTLEFTTGQDNETLEAARKRNIQDALGEDIGRGDLTAQLISPDQAGHAVLTVRQAAVLCGIPWFEGCIRALDPQAVFQWKVEEGAAMLANTTVCEIQANVRAILTAERSALNFLQLLSATATQTRQYVDAIQGASPNPAGCAIMDTRKTLPGLRQAQKYAVRVGGGQNQRMALWHAILIKENHIAAAGGIAQALSAARELGADVSIQIEVENLTELTQALDAGATQILLDNFSLDEMTAAVRMTAGRADLEASGGISLDRLRAIAQTGVNRMSVGTLTKDIAAIDFSLRVSSPETPQ
jgi:nicotinate-nucleotide pyrophosphorylase (carboxylating)